MAIKLSNREKIIALICVVMIGIYVVFQGFIRPGNLRDQNLLKLIAKKHQTLEMDRRTLQESHLIREKYDNYLQTFAQNGSDEQEASALISDVEAVSGKYNIQITNMQPQKVLLQDQYKLMSIQIVFSSSLIKATQFIHELQDAPYFMDVSEIQLEKSLGVEGIVNGRLILTRIRIFSEK